MKLIQTGDGCFVFLARLCHPSEHDGRLVLSSILSLFFGIFAFLMSDVHRVSPLRPASHVIPRWNRKRFDRRMRYHGEGWILGT